MSSSQGGCSAAVCPRSSKLLAGRTTFSFTLAVSLIESSYAVGNSARSRYIAHGRPGLMEAVSPAISGAGYMRDAIRVWTGAQTCLNKQPTQLPCAQPQAFRARVFQGSAVMLVQRARPSATSQRRLPAEVPDQPADDGALFRTGNADTARKALSCAARHWRPPKLELVS